MDVSGELDAVFKRKVWTLAEISEFTDSHGFLPFSIRGGAEDDDPDDETDDEEDEDGENEEDDAAKKSKGDASRKKGGKTTDAKVFTQAELDTALRTRLGRQKERLTTSLRAEIEEELAEKNAKDDGDIRKQLRIANKKLTDMDVLKEMVGKFSELAEARFDAMLQTLPEQLRALAPDEDAGPLEKEAWLTNKAIPAIKLFTKKVKVDDDEEEDAEDATKKPIKGNNPNPPSKKVRQKSVEDHIKQYREKGAYRVM